MNKFFRDIFVLIGYTFFAVFIITCKSESKKKLFQKLEINRTNIDFTNQVEENDSINILEYLSAYNGAGIGAGDFNNDGLIDLYFVANQQANKLYLNRGGFRFEDVTEKAKVGGLHGIDTWSNGVTLIDINDDGWLDIYVCMMHGYLGLKGANQLFVNNGDGTFSENAKSYGLDFSTYSQHAAFFDYDKDGDPDMLLLNQAVHSTASFKPAETRLIRDSMAGDKLLQNTHGKFVDVSAQAGIYGGAMGYGLAVSTGDLNNDGWPDIYISNDFHENDYLYYNQRNGTFREMAQQSTGHMSKSSMGHDIGDFDNDGDLDILTLDMKPPDETMAKQTSGVDPYPVYKYKMDVGYYFQYSRNMLQENLGLLFGDNVVCFSEIGQLMGISDTDWSWSALMTDLDNDGLKDIFISNGIPKRPNSLDYRKLVNENTAKAEATPSDQLIAFMPEGPSPNVVFRNTGESFENVSSAWGLDFIGFSNGAITADLDNDGDLDIVFNNLNGEADMFRNQTSETVGHQFVKVQLSQNSHRHINADVRISVKSGKRQQIQELKSTSGWLSSYVGALVFGLSNARDSIVAKVTWPDGRMETKQIKEPNSTIEFRYENANMPEYKKTSNFEALFTNISDSSGISFMHMENDFVDFLREPLIPRFLSTQGPHMAVGDVSGDGIDDFFIGGARGQAGKIFLGDHSKMKPFREGKNEVFEKHKQCEDIGLALADTDGDGDLDLYVVSGGGVPGNEGFSQDRLYINDGKGNFLYKPDALPASKNNGSCVVALDANADGHIDFFVGGRSIPGKYGISGSSMMLVNDGNGIYTDETGKYLPNNGQIGMVTDAAWEAQSMELIIVGEWMPISIFKFSGGIAGLEVIPNSSGWWNTILVDDLDNDGDMDFLVGNQGLNTDMTASPNQPVELFVKDFDGNLSMDPIIGYYKNGKPWVYPGLDELAVQMPTFRGVFPGYYMYANKTFEEILPPQIKENSLQYQVHTLASMLIEKKGKEYLLKELPLKTQVSPIFGFAVDDFDLDGIKDILAVGNFYDNQLSTGKLDASFGTFLKGKGQLEYEYVEPIKSGFAIRGEARDIKTISTSSKNRLILISRNNDSVCLFK